MGIDLENKYEISIRISHRYWEIILDIAKENGWKPMGVDLLLKEPPYPGFTPYDYFFHSIINVEDSKAIADSLERADMEKSEEDITIGEHDEIIEFLRHGPIRIS